jgi:hypothetical protein
MQNMLLTAMANGGATCWKDRENCMVATGCRYHVLA